MSAPAVLRGLCDAAAVFPPGLASLPDAVAAHRRYRSSWYAGLVGPLVLPAPALAEIGPLRDDDPPAVSVTVPGGPAQVADVLDAAAGVAVTLTALEIAVPDGLAAADVVAAMDAAHLRPLRAPSSVRGGHEDAPTVGSGGVGVYVEIPRDDRRPGLLSTDAAARGAPGADVRALLAERDGTVVAARVAELGDPARRWFTSFGTCSITEPLTELIALGLVEPAEGAPA